MKKKNIHTLFKHPAVKINILSENNPGEIFVDLPICDEM
jgi:hypothetical protein